MEKPAKGAWRELMKKYLKFLKRRPAKAPAIEYCYSIVTDFEFCRSLDELRGLLRRIDTNGYALVSVTQTEDVYTVFFRRPAHG